MCVSGEGNGNPLQLSLNKFPDTKRKKINKRLWLHNPFSFHLMVKLCSAQNKKTETPKAEFNSFIIAATYGYIFPILCLKSQWCFYTCNTYLSPFSLHWNVWHGNMRYFSENRVVRCRMKCLGSISYITWNSLWNATRYSPSLHLASLKFLFLM